MPKKLTKKNCNVLIGIRATKILTKKKGSMGAILTANKYVEPYALKLSENFWNLLDW